MLPLARRFLRRFLDDFFELGQLLGKLNEGIPIFLLGLKGLSKETDTRVVSCEVSCAPCKTDRI